MAPSSSPPKPSSSLPGQAPPAQPAGSQAAQNTTGFSNEEIYDLVGLMEKMIFGKKTKMEPYDMARQLGFDEPDFFYDFIIKLGRDDLIRFDNGKIVINVKMNPVQTEEFLTKYESYLRNGRI
ncbi:hypothetical protein GF325_01785 [Candidatus Bathyarchaeota archaeon]|nr:hypothetical protein [Candidatus Bathyarchaeota archaeon]